MTEHCTTDRASSDLLQHQSWPTLTLRRGEPVVNAREFCKYRFRPLVYWRGDFFEWMGTYYRQISADAVTAEVYSFLDCAKVRVPGKEEGQWVTLPFCPNIASVREVVSALKCLEGKTFVPEGIDAPCWLRGHGNKPDPKNLIALENVILDLETGVPLPHSSDFFTMTALPFAYDENAVPAAYRRRRLHRECAVTTAAQPRLVAEHEAAALLGLSVKTLRRWRWAGRELPFIKLGSAVRYSLDDLERYVAEHRRQSTSMTV